MEASKRHEENNWEEKIMNRNAEESGNMKVSPTRLRAMLTAIKALREERNCGAMEALCILTERNALAPEEDIKEKK